MLRLFLSIQCQVVEFHTSNVSKIKYTNVSRSYTAFSELEMSQKPHMCAASYSIDYAASHALKEEATNFSGSQFYLKRVMLVS